LKFENSNKMMILKRCTIEKIKIDILKYFEWMLAFILIVRIRNKK